ncbi:MAG: cation diffusion facilitator family transporter [Methanobacteriaceae archaeon]|nr:cation diffusion facilitator family transporter [Methanobacteriaceae archaeon]
MQSNYYSTIKRILIIILFLNVGVAMAKIIYGYLTNSLSMVSDGFHSLFDGISNVVGIIGIAIASRPPDKTHPYGHSKFETFAAIGIAVLLFITCFELLQSAVDKFFNPTTPEITVISFLIMGLTMLVNIGVSWYENKKGNELGSDILIADSKHTRSDIYASAAVILGFVAIKFGYVIVDPIIAIIIAVLIGKMGIEIIKESSGVLLDQVAVDPNRIKDIVCAVEGVDDCHRVRTRGSASEIYVDLHVTMAACYSLDEAHNISHKVEEDLKKAIPGINDVVVHIDPCEEN